VSLETEALGLGEGSCSEKGKLGEGGVQTDVEEHKYINAETISTQTTLVEFLMASPPIIGRLDPTWVMAFRARVGGGVA
jgi:hypothetical protein